MSKAPLAAGGERGSASPSYTSKRPCFYTPANFVSSVQPQQTLSINLNSIHIQGLREGEAPPISAQRTRLRIASHTRPTRNYDMVRCVAPRCRCAISPRTYDVHGLHVRVSGECHCHLWQPIRSVQGRHPEVLHNVLSGTYLMQATGLGKRRGKGTCLAGGTARGQAWLDAAGTDGCLAAAADGGCRRPWAPRVRLRHEGRLCTGGALGEAQVERCC